MDTAGRCGLQKILTTSWLPVPQTGFLRGVTCPPDRVPVHLEMESMTSHFCANVLPCKGMLSEWRMVLPPPSQASRYEHRTLWSVPSGVRIVTTTQSAFCSRVSTVC